MNAQTPEKILAALDRPGAGIPLVFRIFNRLVFKPLKIRKTSWDRCEARFQSAHGELKRDLQAFPSKSLTERTLVPPQLGLEDSSRYWSVAMTARHLTIVGEWMEKIIIGLTHGNEIPIKVDTARVKPEEDRNESAAILDYIQFADGVIERINRDAGDKTSSSTHVHPWFGPMTAKDWLWLMGFHTDIHRKQIENIRAGLGVN